MRSVGVLSGVTGNRTRDTRIFSPLLYQLSYDTIFVLELPYLSIGIAKVGIFSEPANFSATFFKIIEQFRFSNGCIKAIRIVLVSSHDDAGNYIHIGNTSAQA